MVRRCVLCSSKTNLHYFPQKANLCNQWVDFVKRFVPEWDGSTSKQIRNLPSSFFSPDCFTNTRQFSMGFASQLMLNKYAVPSIFVEQV